MSRSIEAAGYSPQPILKVIRAKRLDCSYGQPNEVAKCTAVACALWPYRMATNPFTGRKGNPAAFLKKSSAVPSDSDGSTLGHGGAALDLMAQEGG